MSKIKLSQTQKWKKSKASPVTVAIFVLLLIYTIVLIVPIIWAVCISFVNVTQFDIFFTMRNFKDANLAPTFENFVYAWNNLKITTTTTELTFYVSDMLIDSVIYSVGCAAAFTICPAIVAYATARFKFGFSKVVYIFVIITMALPIVGSMASEITMLRNLGIYDTFPAMFILRFNFLSIYFLVLFAQFSSIPMDYTEAAKVDGASNFRIMMQVIMPQALNTIVTVFILSFISYWNDYQIPLLYLPSYPTAAFGIYNFVHNAAPEAAHAPVQLAASVIMVLPIVIVFIIFNKRIRVSVAMGGIKGWYEKEFIYYNYYPHGRISLFPRLPK